jgi:hypothetical protein
VGQEKKNKKIKNPEYLGSVAGLGLLHFNNKMAGLGSYNENPIPSVPALLTTTPRPQ